MSKKLGFNIGSKVIEIDGTGKLIANTLNITGITQTTGYTNYLVIGQNRNVYYQTFEDQIDFEQLV